MSECLDFEATGNRISRAERIDVNLASPFKARSQLFVADDPVSCHDHILEVELGETSRLVSPD